MKINKEILKNTVEAKNQVKLNQNFIGDLECEDAFRIMYIGNSITLHEEKPDIGWPFNHGMAASKPENDYVHLTNKSIKNFLNKPVSALVYNASDFEREYNVEIMSDKLIEQAEKFKPEIIVFRLGENVYKKSLDFAEVESAFTNLVERLLKITDKVIITSLFWYFEQLDNILKNIAEKFNLTYVYIADLGEDDANKAIGKFEHPGIQGHPGDLGMKRISGRIFENLRKTL